MKRASLTETKNNLRALLDQVQNGETILILDHGRPIARLEPVREEDPERRLEREQRILDLEGSVQPKNRPDDFGRIRRHVVGKRGRVRAKPDS